MIIELLAQLAQALWRVAVWFYHMANRVEDLRDHLYWSARNDEADMLQELIIDLNFENGEYELQWQPIATAPRDRSMVLICDQTRKVWKAVTAYWNPDKESWEIISKHHPYDKPTHWFPVPPLPAGK